MIVRTFGNIGEVERSALAREIAKGFNNCGAGAGMTEHEEETCVLCRKNAVIDTENMNICPQCFDDLCI